VKLETRSVNSTFVLANGIIVCLYKETKPNGNHVFDTSLLGALTSPS
jgi:hypothetical protein